MRLAGHFFSQRSEREMKIKEIMNRYLFIRTRDSLVYCGRARTCDSAFPFRMGAGFPGAVNRTHPANIEPGLMDPVAPPTFYGQAVVADNTSANGIRVPKTGDGAANIFGFAVRPFPIQPTTGGLTFAYGAVTPPTNQPIDIMKSGYMIVTLQGAAGAFKGTPIQICTIAGTGYVMGGASVDTVSGTFVQLTGQTYFNGPADAAGLVEIAFNV